MILNHYFYSITSFFTLFLSLPTSSHKSFCLNIISSGSSSPFPSKILESQVLAELIEEAKTKYDYIFIDTPPVLAASDALLISRFVTNYLVIIKHGHTKKNDFDEVVRQFTNNNLEISGVVFDSVANKNKGYYKYNYHYGYGKNR